MQVQKEEQSPKQIEHFGKFNIFLLLKTSQQTYGIKGGDYTRYRKYCTHKLYKLRKSMGFKLGTKNKYIHKDSVKEKPNDIRNLQLLLFNAEKHWSTANQTKFSQARKYSQKSRARFVSIKKLLRALGWAGKLQLLCKEKTDSMTQLEAQAYQLYLEGSLEFERQNWTAAQSKLIACRQIMADLGKNSDSLSEKAYKEKIDQIEQTIKFCNFKISKGKSLSVAQIVQLRKGADASLSELMESLTEKRLKDVSLQEVGEIHFGSERYPIKEEEILKQRAKIDLSMVTLEELKVKWLGHMEDDKLYEELLSFYSDLVLQMERAVRLCDSEQSDPKKKEKYTHGELQILKKVSFLFQEMKMKLFIDRNLIVFKYSHDFNRGRKSSPQTIAKLLTATSSLFQELAEIIKQKGQISNTFEIEVVQAIDAKNFYLRTMRLLFVGQVYFNNGKLKEAMGLWTECERCVKILLSKEEMNENRDNEKFIGSLIPLKRLSETVRGNRCKCIIGFFEGEQVGAGEVQTKFKEMEIEEEAERVRGAVTLQKLMEGKSQLSLQQMSHIDVLQLPGRPQPIPSRPIFFDIVYNSLLYPQVEGKIKKSSKVATSWWGRLFK